MSAEKLTPEHEPKPAEAESAKVKVERGRRLEELEAIGSQEAAEQPERAETARKTAERLAEEPEKTEPKETASFQPGQKAATKKATYRQTVKRIQADLPSARSRRFSKFIHQPTVEAVSEAAAKTVFRPGLTLGLSVGAFLGGTLTYLVAKYYGFRLSGSEFLISALLGGSLGLVLELLLALARRLSGRQSR